MFIKEENNDYPISCTDITQEDFDNYDEYVKRHITNVKLAYKSNYSVLLTDTDLTVEEIEQLEHNIENHDISKSLNKELIPYILKFHVSKRRALTNEEQKQFEHAVDHHYKNNKHHWNHWVGENGIAKEMDEIYIVEMVFDWCAMGKEFNNTAEEYYFKNKDKINLAPNTREQVERLVKIIK